MRALPFRRLNLSASLLLMLAVTGTHLLAHQRVADETRPSAPPPGSASGIKTFEQYAAYWTSEPGWDTELQLKNNLPSAPLAVTPILRLASGQEIPLSAVIIPANASVSVSVNEGLQEHASDLLGQPDSYGTVTFRFQSRNVMNLYATAVPSLRGVLVAFLIHAHPAWDSTGTSGGNGPGSLEGIWWQARSGLKDVLVISNGSDRQIGGTLSLFDARGKQWSEPLSFAPHEIARLAMSELLHRAGLTGNYGGISFEAPAAASAIDSVHLMYDEGGKYSASLEMYHRGPNATVRERTGSDQEQWTMRAPMLALRSPDPALGLPSKTLLQPTLLVRNTTARNVSATIMLSWRGDSSKGQVKLPELQLPPFATQQLPIWTMQKQLDIPNNAHWALVSLTTDALPDDLIAIASSRDCTGEYNAETKFSGGMGGYFVGGEWRTDATHNQIAAITNVGEQATDALLTLRYNNGGKKYELQQTIAPGDQMWVNLAELIRGGLPDRHGNFLPGDVSAVTYDLQDLTPGGHSLMASDLAVDTASGQILPDCPFCCGEDSEYADPDPIELVLGWFSSVSIDGDNGCNGIPSDITGDFTSWNSSNTGVAKVTTAKAQGVGVGNATGYIEGTVDGPGQCACSPHLVDIEVPITVCDFNLGVPGNILAKACDDKTLSTHTFLAQILPSSNSCPIVPSLSNCNFTGTQDVTVSDASSDNISATQATCTGAYYAADTGNGTAGTYTFTMTLHWYNASPSTTTHSVSGNVVCP